MLFFFKLSVPKSLLGVLWTHSTLRTFVHVNSHAYPHCYVTKLYACTSNSASSAVQLSGSRANTLVLLTLLPLSIFTFVCAGCSTADCPFCPFSHSPLFSLLLEGHPFLLRACSHQLPENTWKIHYRLSCLATHITLPWVLCHWPSRATRCYDTTSKMQKKN